jgi:hypothetical protein
MTTFGKVLTFLNLIVAIGMVTWAVGLYSHRPTWFQPPAEGAADKAYGSLSFKQLSDEIDGLNKTSAAASRDWGIALKTLEAREKLHRSRQPLYKQRLDVARNGEAAAKGKKGGSRPGFFEENRLAGTATSDMAKGLTDLDEQTGYARDQKGNKVPIIGPDDRPLQGADTLLETFHKEIVLIAGDPARKIPGLTREIEGLRARQADIQKRIVVAEVKLQKQLRIRTEVQEELLFLEDFRINTGGQRETVYDRKKQLEQRLAEVRGK